MNELGNSDAEDLNEALPINTYNVFGDHDKFIISEKLPDEKNFQKNDEMPHEKISAAASDNSDNEDQSYDVTRDAIDILACITETGRVFDEPPPATPSSDFSLSAIKDSRPMPLELFNPTYRAEDPAMVLDSENYKSDYQNISSVAEPNASDFTSPSSSDCSFEILDEKALSDQEREMHLLPMSSSGALAQEFAKNEPSGRNSQSLKRFHCTQEQYTSSRPFVFSTERTENTDSNFVPHSEDLDWLSETPAILTDSRENAHTVESSEEFQREKQNSYWTYNNNDGFKLDEYGRDLERYAWLCETQPDEISSMLTVLEVLRSSGCLNDEQIRRHEGAAQVYEDRVLSALQLNSAPPWSTTYCDFSDSNKVKGEEVEGNCLLSSSAYNCPNTSEPTSPVNLERNLFGDCHSPDPEKQTHQSLEKEETFPANCDDDSENILNSILGSSRDDVSTLITMEYEDPQYSSLSSSGTNNLDRIVSNWEDSASNISSSHMPKNVEVSSENENDLKNQASKRNSDKSDIDHCSPDSTDEQNLMFRNDDGNFHRQIIYSDRTSLSSDAGSDKDFPACDQPHPELNNSYLPDKITFEEITFVKHGTMNSESAEILQRDQMYEQIRDQSHKRSSLFELESDLSNETENDETTELQDEFFSKMEPYYVIEEPYEQSEMCSETLILASTAESAEVLHRMQMYDQPFSVRSQWSLANHVNADELRDINPTTEEEEQPACDVLHSALDKIFAEQSMMELGYLRGSSNVGMTQNCDVNRTNISSPDNNCSYKLKEVKNMVDGNSDSSLTDDSQSSLSDPKQARQLRSSGRRSWYKLAELPLTASSTHTVSDSMEVQRSRTQSVSSTRRTVVPTASTAGLYEMYHPNDNKYSSHNIVHHAQLGTVTDNNETSDRPPVVASTSQSLESSGFVLPPDEKTAVLAEPPKESETTGQGDHLHKEAQLLTQERPAAKANEKGDCPEMGKVLRWIFEQGIVEPYKGILIVIPDALAHEHTAAILFFPCLLPDRSTQNYDHIMHCLLVYTMNCLEQLQEKPHNVIFFNAGVPHGCEVPPAWLLHVHNSMDMQMRNNLRQIIIVHADFAMKAQLKTKGRAILSREFYRKITYVKSLKELLKLYPFDYAEVPKLVRDYDRRREWKLTKRTCC